MVRDTSTKRELNGVLQWLDGLEAELDAASPMREQPTSPTRGQLPSGRALVTPGVKGENVRVWPSIQGNGMNAPPQLSSMIGMQATRTKPRTGTPPKIRLLPSQSFTGEKFVPRCFSLAGTAAAPGVTPVVRNIAGGSRPLGPLQESNRGSVPIVPPKTTSVPHGASKTDDVGAASGYPSAEPGHPALRTLPRPQSRPAVPQAGQAARLPLRYRTLSPPAVPVNNRTISPSPERRQVTRQASQQILPGVSSLGSPPAQAPGVSSVGPMRLSSHEPSRMKAPPVQRLASWDGAFSPRMRMDSSPRVSRLNTARRSPGVSPRPPAVLKSSPSVQVLCTGDLAKAVSPRLNSALASARSPRRAKSCTQLPLAHTQEILLPQRQVDVVQYHVVTDMVQCGKPESPGIPVADYQAPEEVVQLPAPTDVVQYEFANAPQDANPQDNVQYPAPSELVVGLPDADPLPHLHEEGIQYAEVSRPEMMQLCHTPKLGDEKDLALARLESALRKLDQARNRLHEVESLQEQHQTDGTEGRKSLPRAVGKAPVATAAVGKLNLRNPSPQAARPARTPPRLLTSRFTQQGSPRLSVAPPSCSPRAITVAPRPISRMSSGMIPASSPRVPAASPRIHPACSPKILSSHRDCAVVPVLPLQGTSMPVVQVLRQNPSARRL